METTTYTVIKAINYIDSVHIGTITEQCKKVLSSLQKGESFEARKFVRVRYCPNVDPTKLYKWIIRRRLDRALTTATSVISEISYVNLVFIF